MPSDAAIRFIEARGEQRARLRDASAIAEKSQSPAALLVAAGVQSPNVGLESDPDAPIRIGTPREQDGSAIDMDGYNLKPGTASYQQALDVNTRDLRILKATGEVVQLHEDAVNLGAQNNPGQVIQLPGVPAVQQQPQGRPRILISFGPKEGTLVVGVEIGDEMISRQTTIAAVKALRPIFAALGSIRDVTGGALDDPPPSEPASNVIHLGPASAPVKARSRKAV